MSIPSLVIWPLLVSALVGLITTPLVIEIMVRFGFVVDPKKSLHPAHIHTEPVPKGGGLVVLVAVGVCMLTMLPLDKHLLGIFIALIVSVLIGLIDDVRSISPLLRLVVNFGCAALVVGVGIGIPFITNPFGGIVDLSTMRIPINFLGGHREIWLLADLFALLWIPFLMNAINWSSGVDGQVSGVVAVGAAVIGLLSLSFGTDTTQWPIAILAFATVGAFLSLSLYSFFPQRIMPGYGATTAAGLLLGSLSILSTAKVGTAMVVLGLPLLDAGVSIVRRVLQGKKPWVGDRKHFHHILLELGWSKQKITIFYWLITAILGWVALVGGTEMKIGAILLMGTFIISFSLWHYFSVYSKRLARDSG